MPRNGCSRSIDNILLPTAGEPRWALICCFNARNNSPLEPITHPQYSPHDRWSDASVLELGRTVVAEGDGTVFAGSYRAADQLESMN